MQKCLMKKNARIYIAGHAGLAGSAILRRLKKDKYTDIITRTRDELDLTRQADVEGFFKKERPQFVFLAAAKVGGIQANISYPAQFLYENMAIQGNVIHSAYLCGVKKLLFFGSACAYPAQSPQPIKEKYLLSGYLEPTNEAYAAAKIGGIKLCQAYSRQYGVNFICAMPANIYGPGDNFDPGESHVIPALLKKFHAAKLEKADSVNIWGTGKPLREFIYVDDLSGACIFLMEHYNEPEIINIGTGKEVSVRDLAYLIKDIAGFKGKIIFDAKSPDGAPRKVLETSRLMNLGWQAKTTLKDGIKKTYKWYLDNLD
jgi:GDP-L-fucose synthase